MDIGIGLWCLQSTATNPRSFGRAYQELTEDAQLAEQHGIHSLWLSEHHGLRRVLSCANAGCIRAGSNEKPPSRHRSPPFAVARTAARRQRRKSSQPTIPERFHLGVGIGYRPIEFEMKDRHMSQRLKLMTSGLDTLSTKTDTYMDRDKQRTSRRTSRSTRTGLFISGAFSRSREQAHRRASGSLGKIRTQRHRTTPVGLCEICGSSTLMTNNDKHSTGFAPLSGLRRSWLGADNTGVDFVRN